MKRLFLALTLLLPLNAQAQELSDEDYFVDANILSIFYHELGHALIDIMQLPVFGQEEDAADVASILLINEMFEPDAALEIATDAALGFAAEAELYEGEPTPWWSEHGPDLQRFYNLVCLFYGADPDTRDDFAEDMGLPVERAEYCPEEFELANESWGPVFDDLFDAKSGGKMIYVGPETGFLAQTIADEVTALNAEFTLPQPLNVHVEDCGEANAFYYTDAQEVVFCTEFEQHLRDLWRASR